MPGGRGYSVENARTYGWGPEVPPDPIKSEVLGTYSEG